MLVLLEVDAPLLVGDERAVVGVERRVAVHVQDRRQRAVGRDEHARVDVDLALLEVPVGPHLALLAPATSSRRGRPSSSHSRAIHGPTATTTCSTSIGPALVSTRVTAPEPSSSKPVTSTPSAIRAPAASAFDASPLHRVRVEGEAAPVLVQADGQAGRAPVGEQSPRMWSRHLGLAQDQLGLVADPLLALVRPW